MNDRKIALATLAGDIFHAESPNGASLIRLVMPVTDNTHSGQDCDDANTPWVPRQTGIAEWVLNRFRA
jgi:hypothetical protein